MTTTTFAPMTATEIEAAATLLEWVYNCQKVKFATKDGEVRTAHVRNITWKQGRVDIRAAEVRLTLSTGWEDFWSGAEFIEMIRDRLIFTAK